MNGFPFPPERHRLRAASFDFEAEIMQLLWDRTWKPFSVADVHRNS